MDNNEKNIKFEYENRPVARSKAETKAGSPIVILPTFTG